MNRVLAAVAACLFAASCAGPQVDFCGKSCPGAGSDECGPGYYCNAATNTCQTNGNTCPAVGSSAGSSSSGTSHSASGSSSSSSGSSGASGKPQVNTPCTPPSGTATDPCLADGAGLACNENSTYTATVCTLPQEFQTCVPGINCATESPALVCQSITFSDGTSMYECLNNCSVTTDCPDPDDTCQGTICYTDFCGPDSLPDGGSINAGGLYAPCDSEGTNDGTCLPLSYAGVTYGVCEGNGTLGTDATGCGDRGSGGSASTLCVSGTVCVYSNSDGASFCSPLCAYSSPPNGPACSSTTTCESLGGLFGDCEISCTTSATCPSGLTCQTGYCLP